jgi:DNA-binding transcriptional ArsR family regulator
VWLHPCYSAQTADLSWAAGRGQAAAPVRRLAGQVSLAELASAAEVSHDTVGRGLSDVEQLGLVKRHHQLTRDRDGRVVQAASFFELKPAPESDTQIAGEALLGGDDEWGWWNRDRMLALLAVES